jgi:hypothetical protein
MKNRRNKPTQPQPLIFKKGPKTYFGERLDSSTDGAGKSEHSHVEIRTRTLSFSLSHNNSKWNGVLIVRSETLKLLEKNMRYI